SGLQNVRLQTIESERDPRLSRLRGKADRVLVDAPCSGSGTWRRNPDLKWRLDTATIDRLVQTQSRILDAASRLVKAGGHLLYATCSLLPDENEQRVEAFLAAHPEFEITPVQDSLDRRGVTLPTDGPFLRLLPHRDHTDGFFAACLIRTL
ncbi:MAG: RsmB/NOP family class I SAM-dependent RNA methyltransferase, partial [Acidiferrobacteraceae bacterium]